MWEYKFLILSFGESKSIDENKKHLNAEGADGWEVVCLLPKSAVLPKAAGADCIALLKRPKEAEEKGLSPVDRMQIEKVLEGAMPSPPPAPS